MPRNRTVRLAVLGSSVQRAALAKYPSKTRSAIKRRVVVGVLVVLSLVMITLSFRGGAGTGLDNLQNAGATALQPLQVGIERVVRPFRDLYGYMRDLTDAKSENERLRAELRVLRQQAANAQLALEENAELQSLLDYRRSRRFPDDFDTVAAQVIIYPLSQFDQRVVVAAGSADGVRVNDPVVDGDGLVGKVTKVMRSTAQVTLLTDEESAVTAVDSRTGARGIVRRDPADGDLLVLEANKRDDVNRGDSIVTAGSQRGELPSLYPRGILIGRVVFVQQTDVDPFKQVRIKPVVDFRSVDSVMILVPER